jgi:hypothetical protein
MIKELFAHGPVLLPVAGMLFFFAVFAIVLARTLSRRRGHYDAMAELPLENRQ